MKRIVALLLALVMALSTALAVAEPAQVPKDGLLLESTTNIDRDRVARIMDELELDEKTRDIVDSALAVVNAATGQLVITENGVGYEVFLNQAEVLRFTLGKSDEGLVALSNLIPRHALTVSNDIVNVATGVFDIVSEISRKFRVERKVEAYRAKAAVTPYITDFIVDVLAAMRFGEAEKGEFVLQNGKSYNTRMKISFDRQAIADALNNLMKKVLQDSFILTVLVNVLVTNEDLANSALVAENVPAVDIILYKSLDDKGEELSPDRAYAASLTLPGQAGACASLELHQGQDSLQILLNIPGSDGKGGGSAAFSFVPYDKAINGASAELEVSVNGNYYGDVFTIGFDEEKEALIAGNALYIQDQEAPLATQHITIRAGEPALDLSTGDKRVVPVESLLFGGESKKLKKQLMGEIMFSGLGIIGKANKAVPEFAKLLTLLNSAGKEANADGEEAE